MLYRNLLTVINIYFMLSMIVVVILDLIFNTFGESSSLPFYIAGLLALVNQAERWGW